MAVVCYLLFILWSIIIECFSKILIWFQEGHQNTEEEVAIGMRMVSEAGHVIQGPHPDTTNDSMKVSTSFFNYFRS